MKNIVVFGTWTLILCIVFNIDPAYGVQNSPPDSIQAAPPTSNAYHLYTGFDIGTYYPSFNNVFMVIVTDGVEAAWDSAGVAEFIELVMDDDSTNTADVFPAVWNYFCYGDSNPSYAGVRFTMGRNRNIKKIPLYLYDKNDFDCQIEDPPRECTGYSWLYVNNLILNATNKEPQEVARDAFAHELQHICFEANYGSGSDPLIYGDVNESLSTCAEYMWKAWEVVPANVYDQSYDASIFRCERCDPDAKYMAEQVWMGYLFDVFRGNPADITDDIVYNWLRYRDATERNEISMNSLAIQLEDASYSWLGGSVGEERLRNLFQNFLVAKFCNAPDFSDNDRYGYDDFSPVNDLGFFLDLNEDYDPGATPQTPVDCPEPAKVCPDYPDPIPPGHGGSWNVRILPPSYVLGSESEDIMIEVSGIYRDGDDTPADTTDGDKSRDYIDVALWGTDYIIFKAANYFQDGEGHEFHFALEGESATPPTNTEAKMWVIGYSSTEDTLQFEMQV